VRVFYAQKGPKANAWPLPVPNERLGFHYAKAELAQNENRPFMAEFHLRQAALAETELLNTERCRSLLADEGQPADDAERRGLAGLLYKRAAKYIASEQWDLAKADWVRMIAMQPDQVQQAFDIFRNAERWSEAAAFGQILSDQNPRNTILWVKVAPLAVLSDDDAIYKQLCRRVLELYREAPTAESVHPLIKACLLKRGTIDISELPLDTFPTSLDSTAPDWLPPWFWGTRAMLAYRSGDADAAVKYVNQSEQHQPNDYAHAMNLTILAMAQHELQHPDEARIAVEEATQLIERLRAGDRNHHDLLIAEILFREAEALIDGTTKPKPADDATTPQP